MVTGGFADEDGVLRSMLVQIQPSAFPEMWVSNLTQCMDKCTNKYVDS